MTLRHERAERHTIQHFRKGDQVKIIAGRDSGKTGRVLSINAKKNTVLVEHARDRRKRHTRPNPRKESSRAVSLKKQAGQRLERDAVVCPSCWQAHPHRPQHRGRTARRAPAGACGTTTDKQSAMRNGQGRREMKTRLHEKYSSEAVPALMKRFGWENRPAVPKLQKVTVNNRTLRAKASSTAKLRLDSRCKCGARPDHWPERGHHARQEVDRQLQDPQGHADRLRRHAARR